MNAYKNVACFFVAMTIASSAVAQSYYDDDIYYNADKAKKEKAVINFQNQAEITIQTSL